MPIYAYKCESCGHRQDVLQKMSDPLLTDCPSCGAAAYVKQVTAAGFQLKGSGWYVTDFRGGNTAAKSADADADAPAEKAADAPAAPVEGGASKAAEPAAAAAPAASPAATPAPAKAAAPASAPTPKSEASKPSSGG